MVVIDVSGLDEPDAGTIDVLAHMQLVARRHGATLRFRHPCPDLVGLIRLAGLSDVLPLESAVESILEADGQAEEHEQAGIEEDVDRPDPPR